jgi:HNH endonuclease
VQPGDVISYLDMCREEGVNLQAGMNFRLRGSRTIVLMSLRPGAPYQDRVEENGKVLIYEGHDEPRRRGGPEPKSVDQPTHHSGGGLTQNGRFMGAVEDFKAHRADAERVHVYEKLRSGVWAFAGIFRLTDGWQEDSGGRQVFKFRLEVTEPGPETTTQERDLEHTRVIPTPVKLEVWARDGGRCVECGSSDNLHFDHVIPYSQGGSSLVADNIQLLCARHNLSKGDRLI